MTLSLRTRLLSLAAIGMTALVLAVAPVPFGPSLGVDAWADHPGNSGPGNGSDPSPGGSGPGNSGSGEGSPGKSGPGNS